MLSEPAGVTYSRSVEQLGITPVYPPREGLQVGDIYAAEPASQKDRLKAKSAFIAPFDLSQEITAFLATRYKFAETTIELDQNGNKLPTTKAWQADLAANKGVVAPGLGFTTLPVAGLPAIEVNSGVSIGVGGQPKGLLASFGFAASRTLKMSLQYHQVTSYEVPPVVAHKALDYYCSNQDVYYCASDGLAVWINQKYQLAGRDEVKDAGVMMVSKVYLARQITYTFNDASVAALAVASQSAQGNAAPFVSSEDIQTILNEEDPEIIKAQAIALKAVTEYVSKSKEGDANLQISAVKGETVAITETFPRPVVIGYESVSRVGGKPLWRN